MAICADPVAGLALERRFPALCGLLPRVALTVLPTPVHPLSELARATGAGPLFAKRDDLTSALYGGNKPRKLELVLGAAQAHGARTLITFGGIGTHHGLATTLAARSLGMRTILVLVPQPVTAHTRRTLQTLAAAGAELHLAAGTVAVARRAIALYARAWHRGERPVIVPAGGSSALGTLGYVNAALELAEQVHAGIVPEPDEIFVPLGSGGTLAGLVLGTRLAALRSHVVGVLVTDILPPSPARLAGLARAALRRLRALDASVPEVAMSAADFDVRHGWIGAGYGAPTAAADAARALIGTHADIRLETTYSAKCLAALLEAARDDPARTRLFWNTFSAVDPADGIVLPAPADLPPAFARFF